MCTCNGTECVSNEVANGRFACPDHLAPVLVEDVHAVVAMAYLLCCHLLHHGLYAIRYLADVGILLLQGVHGDEFRVHVSVGADNEFAHVLESGPRLRYEHRFTLGIEHGIAWNGAMRVSVQHHIYATRTAHKAMAGEEILCRCLAQMSQKDDIMGTFLAGLVHGFLHLFHQVVLAKSQHLSALLVEEGVCLAYQRFGSHNTHEGYLRSAEVLNNIRCEEQGVLMQGAQIHVHHGQLALRHELGEVRCAEVELVIAQSHGIVPHLLHYVHHEPTTGDCTCGTSVQEVAATGKPNPRGVRNGICQTAQTCISVHNAMCIVLVDDNYALLLAGIASVQKRHKKKNQNQMLDLVLDSCEY